MGFKTLRIGHAWPKRKPSTIILLKDHNINSKTLIDILLSPSISALLNSQLFLGDAYVCSNWELTQRPIIWQYAESDFVALSPK